MLAAAYIQGKLAPDRSALGETFTRFAASLAGIRQPKAAHDGCPSLPGGRRGCRPIRLPWRASRRKAPPPERAGAPGDRAWRPVRRLAGRAVRQPGECSAPIRPGARRRARRAPAVRHMAGHDLREPARLIAGYVQLLAQYSNGKLGARATTWPHRHWKGCTARGADRCLIEYTRVTTGGAGFQPTSCEQELPRPLPACARASTIRPPSSLTTGCRRSWRMPPRSAAVSQFDLQRPHVPLPRRARRACPVRGRESEWEFAVRDNGVGLDPQYGNRIFLLFQRLHTRTEHPGAGVGLAVAKKIVERHGGRIWVESEPGKGPRFISLFPNQALALAVHHPAWKEKANERAAMRVLLLEGNPAMRAPYASCCGKSPAILLRSSGSTGWGGSETPGGERRGGSAARSGAGR